MVLDSYSLVDFYMYVFGTIILYEITLKLCKNDLLNLCDQFGIFSVNTKTEPKVPKPNFLGTDFWKEPISTYFSRNQISVGTKVPNHSVRYYRMPMLTDNSCLVH